MKLYAFESKEGNFGDDLNGWLWPKLFGPDLDCSPHTTLVGIGSVLDERISRLPGKKIIFGSGIRSTKPFPAFDSSTTYRFVRGPISASVLKGGARAITDPAILVRPFVPAAPARTYVGLMPHYHSLPWLDWQSTAAELGFRYIDPRWNVDRTLSVLNECERVVTEAMHGAIVADALRIPWNRFTLFAWRKEGFDVSSLKWLDWGLSTEVDVTPVHLGPFPLPRSSRLLQPLQWMETRRIGTHVISGLRRLRGKTNGVLSSDDIHRRLLAECQHEVQELHAWLQAERHQ